MLEILDELVQQQRKKVFSLAREIVPYITEEDVLQPNDFPELENNPIFRYEEGVLEGLLSVRMALSAQKTTV